nr:MAG TPA: hypothetical protein [Caudoviricetes sp.]
MEDNNQTQEQLLKQYQADCPFIEQLNQLVLSNGINRVKIETPSYKYDFRATPDNTDLSLVSLKAIIRAYGRTTVVPITPELPTHEAARGQTVERLREYVREYRRSQPETVRRQTNKRQRAYARRKREAAAEFERRQ